MVVLLAYIGFLFLAYAACRIALVCRDAAQLFMDMLANPFTCPHFETEVDVSRKRQPDSWDVVDRFLCDADNRAALRDYAQRVEDLNGEQKVFLTACRMPFRRLRQYVETTDAEASCCFVTVRDQTRYHQVNWVREPYTVSARCAEYRVSLETLAKRDEKLAAIGYEATLREYNAKNQRRLMTPELRRQIMERDGYTCRLCGRYMPDGNGLHIDHIVPISKGGKTVPSNLQVLCAKCNLSKGAKLIES